MCCFGTQRRSPDTKRAQGEVMAHGPMISPSRFTVLILKHGASWKAMLPRTCFRHAFVPSSFSDARACLHHAPANRHAPMPDMFSQVAILLDVTPCLIAVMLASMALRPSCHHDAPSCCHSFDMLFFCLYNFAVLPLVTTTTSRHVFPLLYSLLFHACDGPPCLAMSHHTPPHTLSFPSPFPTRRI